MVLDGSQHSEELFVSAAFAGFGFLDRVNLSNSAAASDRIAALSAIYKINMKNTKTRFLIH